VHDEADKEPEKEEAPDLAEEVEAGEKSLHAAKTEADERAGRATRTPPEKKLKRSLRHLLKVADKLTDEADVDDGTLSELEKLKANVDSRVGELIDLWSV